MSHTDAQYSFEEIAPPIEICKIPNIVLVGICGYVDNVVWEEFLYILVIPNEIPH